MPTSVISRVPRFRPPEPRTPIPWRRFAFGKVYTLHIVGLHFMIVGARCQEDIGTDPCSTVQWGTAVITLYICYLVRVRASTNGRRRRNSNFTVAGEYIGCTRVLELIRSDETR